MSALTRPSVSLSCACASKYAAVSAVGRNTSDLKRSFSHLIPALIRSSNMFLCAPETAQRQNSPYFISYHTLKYTNSFTIKCKEHKITSLTKKDGHMQGNYFPSNLEKRTFFWRSVQSAFNEVDGRRLHLYGADRVCAEWVLRNGGGVRWVGSKERLPLMDYNLLPDETESLDYTLEEIDLTGSDVLNMGFKHLKNLKHLKSIKMRGVSTLTDDSIQHFLHVKSTLENVEIGECKKITEDGLACLHELKNLKHVTIYKMNKIPDLESAVSNMKDAMPWCTFDIKDPMD